MRRTGLTAHHGMFKLIRNELQILMGHNKTFIIAKLLFKVVGILLHCKSSVLPNHASGQLLANKFCKYFENKIDVIWRGTGPHIYNKP